MKITIKVKTEAREEMVDITAEVQREVKKAGVQNGVCVVYVPHTTAGVTINEHADPAVARDLLEILDRLVPKSGAYRHTEGNADAHLKASLIGSSAMVLVESGKLALGTWQGIFFCEFDGPRNRNVYVQLLPAE